jgi:hypothetical protein
MYSDTNVFMCAGEIPNKVAERRSARTVFAGSTAGIVGLNPICMRLFCVCVILRVDRDIVMGWSHVQWFLLIARC